MKTTTYIFNTNYDGIRKGTELTLGDDNFYYCKNYLGEECAFSEEYIKANPFIFSEKQNTPQYVVYTEMNEVWMPFKPLLLKGIPTYKGGNPCYFETKEMAEQFIYNNKPVISYNDFKEILANANLKCKHPLDVAQEHIEYIFSCGIKSE